MNRILVIGDLMLDADIHYQRAGCSPEGAPVYREAFREHRFGGAGSVAMMCAALGADGVLLGVSGDSDELDALCDEPGHKFEFCTIRGIDKDRPATRKTRCFLRGRLIARIDRESTAPIAVPDVESLLDFNRRFGWPDDFDAIIVADHAKGVVTPYMWARLLDRFPDVPIFVDPAKGKPASFYKGATCIVMNREEAGGVDSVSQAEQVACNVRWVIEADAAIVKLDCDGYVLSTDAGVSHEPSHVTPDQIVDTVGAGDAFIAALAVTWLANGGHWRDAARVGNVAAGLNCGKCGATPVTRTELESALCATADH